MGNISIKLQDWVGTKAQYLALENIDQNRKYYLTDLEEFSLSNSDMELALNEEASLYELGSIFVCKDSGTYDRGTIYQFMLSADGSHYYWDAISRATPGELAPDIIVDDFLSAMSTNPVQNKIITEALNAKADKSEVESKADKSELDSKANASDIPTDNTQLGNGAGYITESALQPITERIDEVESVAKGAGQAIVFNNYSDMVSDFNSKGNSTYKIGQNVMIIALEVPDLWISNIMDTYSEYVYNDNISLIESLKQNGKVQIGYYEVSMLETQKVDLTNYASTEYVDGKVSSLNTEVDGKVSSLNTELNTEIGKKLDSSMIVYSETEPASPVEGMIWLKPVSE